MVNLNKLAVISDIHGNRWALEAVLEDIHRRGIREIVNLGDALYGPLDPAGTAELLLELDVPTVRGNEDRLIVEQSAPSHTLSFVLQSLGPLQISWLQGLPLGLVVRDDILLCHGTPADDAAYLLWDVLEDGAQLRAATGLLADLNEWPQPIVLCGHDHSPRTMYLPGGRIIVNPGSVGLPAYSDDSPHPHVMATGSPHARYAIVANARDGWVVEQLAIPYDWNAAADMARSNGRADWADWLLSGEA
jgi:predicted phosphodiesterase